MLIYLITSHPLPQGLDQIFGVGTSHVDIKDLRLAQMLYKIYDTRKDRAISFVVGNPGILGSNSKANSITECESSIAGFKGKFRPTIKMTSITASHGFRYGAREYVHGWRTDELGHEKVGGLSVELDGCADLLDVSVFKHDDAISQCHRFHLIMRDVNHCDIGHALFELRQFYTCCNPQGCIKIRQGFVEQEHTWISDDCAADRNALSLSAGKGFWQALQIIAELENLACFLTRLSISVFATPAIRRPKAIFS